jgi:acetyl-CoA acetyltransferase
MAEVAARSWRDAKANPYAQLSGDLSADDVLATDPFVDPLRRHDCAPITDGAAAMVLAAGDVARELCERPAWIRGIDHRIEAHMLGVRDLTTSTSTAQAAAGAGVADGPVDVAELHAPFTHQELILASALGLGDGTALNPSGGALCANPMMAAGLVRMGEVANRISAGEADRGVAHATSGPCLQQNLVCVLEGE